MPVTIKGNPSVLSVGYWIASNAQEEPNQLQNTLLRIDNILVEKKVSLMPWILTSPI